MKDVDLDMIMTSINGATEPDLRGFVKSLVTEVRKLRNGTVSYVETTQPEDGQGQRSFKTVFEPGITSLKEDLEETKATLARVLQAATAVIEHATGRDIPIGEWESVTQIWAAIDQHEVNFAHEYSEQLRSEINEALFYPCGDDSLIEDELAVAVLKRLESETFMALSQYEVIDKLNKQIEDLKAAAPVDIVDLGYISSNPVKRFFGRLWLKISR